MTEERLREIIREEIAAQVDGKRINELLGKHLKEKRIANGETWLDDTL